MCDLLPFRASLHFYVNKNGGYSIRILVSIPIRASLHFYMTAEQATEKIQEVCQCPFGLFFISTDVIEEVPEGTTECQCPFGLLFISTMKLTDGMKDEITSVNAHSGFSSFPQGVKKDRNSNILCVNAHSDFSSFPLFMAKRPRR